MDMKKIISIFLCTFMSFHPNIKCICIKSRNFSMCPRFYLEQRQQDVCYRAVFQKLTREEANQYCIKNGGVLASVLNPRANNNLYEMIYLNYGKRFKNNEQGLPFWIGLHKKVQKKEFRWSSCKDGVLGKSSYVNWGRNEIESTSYPPLGGDQQKKCVTWIWSQSPEWRTQNCSEKHSFICQVELPSSQVNTTPSYYEISDHQPTFEILRAVNVGLPVSYIVFIGVGVLILFLIVLIISIDCYKKWKAKRKRNALLRKTGIFPALAVVNTAIPKQAWIKQ